jgi:hypothetical protein
VTVEAIPPGFKIRRLKYGATFFCAICNREAITSKLDD